MPRRGIAPRVVHMEKTSNALFSQLVARRGPHRRGWRQSCHPRAVSLRRILRALRRGWVTAPRRSQHGHRKPAAEIGQERSLVWHASGSSRGPLFTVASGDDEICESNLQIPAGAACGVPTPAPPRERDPVARPCPHRWDESRRCGRRPLSAPSRLQCLQPTKALSAK